MTRRTKWTKENPQEFTSDGLPLLFAANVTITPTPQGRDTPGLSLNSNYPRKLKLMSQYFGAALEHFSCSKAIRSDVILLMLDHSWPIGEFQLEKEIYKAIELASKSAFTEVRMECFENLFTQPGPDGMSPIQRLKKNVIPVLKATPSASRLKLAIPYYAEFNLLAERKIRPWHLADTEYWTFMVRVYMYRELDLLRRNKDIPRFPESSDGQQSAISGTSGRPNASTGGQSSLAAGVKAYSANSAYSQIVFSGRKIDLSPENSKTLQLMHRIYGQTGVNSFVNSELDNALQRRKRSTRDNLRKSATLWGVVVASHGRGRLRFLILPDTKATVPKVPGDA